MRDGVAEQAALSLLRDLDGPERGEMRRDELRIEPRELRRALT